VGLGTEVTGIRDRRGEKLVKDMGMIGGDEPEKVGVSLDSKFVFTQQIHFFLS